MESWDGPAALCGFGGRWLVAGMDRNGLRPMRYTITDDGLIFAGSETGMVRLDEARITEKGRIGPGQMLALDLDKGRLYRDGSIKDRLAGARPFGDWVRNITVIDDLVKPDGGETVEFAKEELRRRQSGYGVTLEDLAACTISSGRTSAR
jgi:glutamate synthase (NADPH/NADH) large chain